MAIDNFIPEIWSTELLVTFRKNFVFSGLTNRNWEGDVMGNQVKIQTPATVPVVARSGSITYTTPTSTTQNLDIDQDFEWAFEVEDLEEVQSNINLLSTYTAEGANSMADKLDQDVAGLYVDGTAPSVSLTLASDDVYQKIVDCAVNLDLANVPTNGRWLVVSPAVKGALLKNTNFIHATPTGDQRIRSGEIGNIAGFNVYVSNNLTLATQRKCMYSHISAITWAGQLSRFEALRDKDTWYDYVRARMVWGRKVVRPTALGLLDTTE